MTKNLTVVPKENLLLATFPAKGCDAGIGVAMHKDEGYGYFVDVGIAGIQKHASDVIKWLAKAKMVDHKPTVVDLEMKPKFVKQILTPNQLKICSKGIMVKIPNSDDFILVSMTKEEMSDHAQRALRFYTKLQADKTTRNL